jgi:NarL family two-component system response regulator YdfI
MRVLITDDHAIVREGIRWMLETEAEIEIAGECGSGEELLDSVADVEPDVVLLDIRMPGMSGLETLEALRKEQPDLPVLMLTMHDEPELVAGSIGRGANGYLLKSAGRDELIAAIKTVGRGGAFLQGELTVPLLTQVAEGRAGDALPQLDLEDSAILNRVAKGLGNRDISIEFDITETAVKTALQRIFTKLQVHNRAEAVAVALRLGIID